jgi:hypothetical protein
MHDLWKEVGEGELLNSVGLRKGQQCLGFFHPSDKESRMMKFLLDSRNLTVIIPLRFQISIVLFLPAHNSKMREGSPLQGAPERNLIIGSQDPA